MKTSLSRWQRFTYQKHSDSKDRRNLRPRPLSLKAELAQASQDMEDLKNCYDSLLSAAAAATNCAYEFSVSLQELGACLLEKTASNDDEESGKVLLMLGKVQFELQELLDSYRTHISQTITVPSESLLNELQTVEEMKQQCDEKRNVYEDMRQREKGRSKGGKGETFSMQQLEEAHDAYDQEATLFVFRLKSLKQGQSRSLLTQAARHHAAQLSFVKKALKSLGAVDPHVQMVTEQQHIDYQFRELEDDDMDDVDDDNSRSDSHGDGDLSFDCRENGIKQDAVSSPRISMKENLDGSYRKSPSFSREVRGSSQSAPLFVENKSDLFDRRKQMRQLSTRKFNTYVLPTPGDTKSSHSPGPGIPVPSTLKTSFSGQTYNFQHSSPFHPTKFNKSLGDEKISKDTAQSIHRESNNNTASTQLPPPPLGDGFLLPWLDPSGASDKFRRQSFSGPLPGPWPAKNPKPQPPSSPPKVSPRSSPTFVSSPKISELHELPRPPARFKLNSSSPTGLVGHSAPLFPKGHVLSAPSISATANAASKPPQAITRSYSIPSSSHKMEANHDLEMASPPLTPISLSNKNPSSAYAVEIKGAE